VMSRAKDLAETLLANSPQSMRATKQLLADQNRARLQTAIALALDANAESRLTSDFHEGVSAFLEKRKPAWKS
jgi:methylglutaconyl-CoA hydratase